MRSFTHLAYSTIILFLEEFPSFKDTWHEYLGHISRYKQSIYNNPEHWKRKAHYWYSEAFGSYPTAGWANFNLGLTSPTILQELFYYSKALYAVPCYKPPINSFFNDILELPYHIPLLKAHASLFTGKKEDFGFFRKEFLDRRRNTPIGKGKTASRIAIINITAMLGYGNMIPEDETIVLGDQSPSKQTFENARLLNHSTLEILLQRDNDTDSVLPFIYINLVFMYGMSHHRGAMHHLEFNFPWNLLSNLLNSLVTEDVTPECVGVLRLQKDSDCPPAEDELMHGLFWAQHFLQNAGQFGKPRNERIFYLAHKLAELGHGLNYNSEFSALSNTGKDIHEPCLTIDSRKDEASMLSEEEYVLVDRDDLVQEGTSSTD
jgi:hypothetical protein